jgi:hypothetical protein
VSPCDIIINPFIINVNPEKINQEKSRPISRTGQNITAFFGKSFFEAWSRGLLIGEAGERSAGADLPEQA